jgi:hypothetical protein
MQLRLTGLVLLIYIMVITSCASTKPPSYIQKTFLEIEPTLKVVIDPSYSSKNPSTFTISSASLSSDGSGVNQIEEKQLMFFVQCTFEQYGYTYVDPNENPDLSLVIFANSEYQTSYIPPSAATRLKYTPRKTTTTSTNSSGSASATVFGTGGVASGTGRYSGKETSTTTTPGKLTTESYTRPGYTVGNYYPSFGINAYEGYTDNLLWTGTATGTSNLNDIRISSQVLIRYIIGKIPPCAPESTLRPLSQGIWGIMPIIMTTDGNNYFPIIFNVTYGSPAQVAGLRKWDAVIDIDGISCQNASTAEIYSLLAGVPGESSSVSVWRNGQTYRYKVIRGDRSKIYK